MKYLLILVSFLPLLISCNKEDSNKNFDFNFPEDCCDNQISLQISDEVFTCPSTAAVFDSLLINSIYIPCVFSPDSDQLLNRTHHIFSNQWCADICDVKIYDQAGNEVFSNGEYSVLEFEKGWDGTVQAEMVEGPFEISYKLKCIDDRDYEITGIICALLCDKHQAGEYSDLNFSNLLWPSQHDGKGGVDFTLPSDDCIK